MKQNSSKKLNRDSRRKANLPQVNNDGDSSLSSLGSLPEATSVSTHFVAEDLPSQRRFTTHLTQSAPMQNPAKQPNEPSSSSRNSRQINRNCPHCQRRFTNAWAIPKHVSVSFVLHINVSIILGIEGK